MKKLNTGEIFLLISIIFFSSIYFLIKING